MAAGRRKRMNDPQKPISPQQKIAELSAAIDSLRLLAQTIIAEREDEICRYTREVHNVPSQLLTQLSLILYQLKNTSPETAAILDEAVSLVKQVSSEIRRIYQDTGLAMLDHIGLEDTLAWLFEQREKTSGIVVDFRYASRGESVSPEVSRAVLRIADAFISRVAASTAPPEPLVEITDEDDSLVLVLSTEGGRSLPDLLSPASLTFIEERARMANGHVEIGPGSPTSLRCIFPVAD